MKKLFSLFLSAVIVSCYLCSAPFTASANTFNNAYGINLNEPYSAVLSASSSDMTKLWTVFDCTASGYYEVVCTSAEAPDNTVYLGVYDEDKTLIDYKVNTDLSASFSAVTYFESGYKYYYYITTDSDSYSFDLTISTHTHSYSVSQRIKAVADDDEGARTDGYERMVCEACKQYYDTAVYYAPSSVVLSKTLYTASGTEKKPSVTVYDRAGNIISSSEYTVTYEDNITAGKAFAFITFNSDIYDGELTASFIIKPQKQSLVSVTAKSKGFKVKWTKNTSVTGYEIQYSTSKKFTAKTTKTVTVAKNTTASKTVKSLKGNKKYYVRVRSYKTIDSVKYYGAWSAKTSVKTKK